MNLVTDLCIMAIPAPVILPVRTTLLRKIGLIILFFAGFFIMLAAVMRVVFVLVLGNGVTAAIWSCREDIVAILVGQAILIRPLFTRTFWTRDFASVSRARLNAPDELDEGDSKNASRYGYALSQVRFGKSRTRDPFSLSAALGSIPGSEAADKIDDVESSGASTSSGSYRPAPPAKDGEVGPGRGAAAGLVINVSRQIEVERVESPTGKPESRGSCLTATNQAQCWKGDSDGEGLGQDGASSVRERAGV